MGIIIPTGFSQVTLRWRAIGAIRDAVITYGIDSVLTPVPLTIATDINAFMKGGNQLGVAANLGTPWQYRGVHVTTMLGDGPASVDIPEAINGSLSQDTPPPNFSVLVRKITTLGGKQNRGRFYVPPVNIAEGSITSLGELNTGARTAQQNIWDSHLSQLALNDYPMVLLHSAEGVAPSPVAGLVVEARGATQRRRLRR